MELPRDPFILLSYLNTQLRDNYTSLIDLCSSLGVDRFYIIATMKSIGFEYSEKVNQFR